MDNIKKWLEELIHEKYNLTPTDSAQKAIIEIESKIKELEAKSNNKNLRIKHMEDTFKKMLKYPDDCYAWELKKRAQAELEVKDG